MQKNQKKSHFFSKKENFSSKKVKRLKKYYYLCARIVGMPIREKEII